MAEPLTGVLPVPAAPATVDPSPTPVVPVEGGEQVVNDKVLTLSKDEILKLIQTEAERIATVKSAEAVQNAQSLTDKAEKRIREETDSRFSQLQNAGVQLSEEQKINLKNSIASQIKSESTEDIKPVSEDPKVAALREFVNQKVAAINAKYGNSLVQGDLEVSKVNWQNPDPFEFAKEYEAAIQAKADRLKAPVEVSEDEEVDEEDLRARQPMSGGGVVPDNLDKLSSYDLLKAGYARKKKK